MTFSCVSVFSQEIPKKFIEKLVYFTHFTLIDPCITTRRRKSAQASYHTPLPLQFSCKPSLTVKKLIWCAPTYINLKLPRIVHVQQLVPPPPPAHQTTTDLSSDPVQYATPAQTAATSTASKPEYTQNTSLKQLFIAPNTNSTTAVNPAESMNN